MTITKQYHEHEVLQINGYNEIQSKSQKYQQQLKFKMNFLKKKLLHTFIKKVLT